MIKFFRSSFVSQYLVIALTGLLLWIRAFLDPPSMPEPSGPVVIYKFLYLILSPVPVLAVLTGFLITLFSGFYLNYLLSYHEITPKNASLPAFIFVIFSSYYPSILTLNPVNLSVLVLVFILQRLFTVYRKTDPLDTTYGVGFLTAVASFIYFPFIFFFILILISLIVFRIAGWREWLSSLFGLLTPFIFVFTYFFWFDLIPDRLAVYRESFRIILPVGIFKGNSFDILSIIMVVLLFTGFLSGLAHLNEKTLEIRHKTAVLIWMLPVIFMQFPFSGIYIRYHLIISFITVAALFSGYLMRLRKPKRLEVLLLLIFAAILVNNLFFILV